MKNWLYLFGCIILIIGCKPKEVSLVESLPQDVSPLERLANNEAGSIVKKAIDQAGGWDNWTTTKTLSYTKVIQYFDSTGTMEREVNQLHQYLLHPQLKMRISWEEDGDKFVIVNNGQQAWKMKNGQQQTEQTDLNYAWNSSFGAHYTICMPFKLTDHGTVMTYEGLDTLDNGKVVHAIKTTYEEGAGSSAGVHRWRFYFDSETYELAANFLDHGAGFSYTQYVAFTDIDKIKLNVERHGYRTNAERELKYKRAVYKSENMQFNINLDDVQFEPMN